LQTTPVSAQLLLMELHSLHCTCGGGAYVVAAGQIANAKCLGPDGEAPADSAYMSMDEWAALGKPVSTEAQRAALQKIADRREAPRIKVSVNVRLLRVQAPSDVLGLAVTENLGEGGALLLTTVSAARGDGLIVEELQGALRTRAQVQEATAMPSAAGQPAVFRLRLRFLDAEAARQVRKLLYARTRPHGEEG
jgi:hypothetical protein